MVICCVMGCKNESYPGSRYSFHGVQKHLSLWEKVVIIKSKSVYARICSQHFTDNDFIGGIGRRILKPDAVPSVNVVSNDEMAKVMSGEMSTDDEDDNEKLSVLKRLSEEHSSTANDAEQTYHSNSEEDDSENNLPHHFQMVVPCTCNSAQSSNSLSTKHTNDVGVQTKIKTDKEASLQAKVKTLQSRLKRRDAKISYMQTVLKMIKKHTKGTDMEYKLCCELQNIAEFPETVKTNGKGRRKDLSRMTEEVERPVSASSGDENAGTFLEVVASPNLKRNNGFSTFSCQ